MTITQTEFQKKWAETLRSGQFLQAHGVLEGTPKFTHDGKTTAERYEHDDRVEFISTTDCDTLDPENDTFEVVEEGAVGYCCLGLALQITGGDPDVAGQDGEMPSRAWCAAWGLSYEAAEELAALNDADQSFDFIADVIEMAPAFVPYDLDEVDA